MLWNRSSTCCWSELICADICLNLGYVSRAVFSVAIRRFTYSSLSLKLLQQLGEYWQSRLRFPQRWQGVWPLHLIFRRLHSLQAMEM